MTRRVPWPMLGALLATALVLVPLSALAWSSRLPATYSAMEMGYVDLGGGPAEVHDQDGPVNHRHLSVAELTADAARPADVELTLVAREEEHELPSGREVDGYTLNHQTPGPEIRAELGDLVEVTLVNESVPDGATLHWHGINVPNAEDGVAGITQDAVLPGQRHIYRFVAEQTGTYWYHSHQVSHEQVRRGLLGPIVIDPPGEPAAPAAADVDLVALSHLYDGVRTVNGRDGDQLVEMAPGEAARVRVINTDNGPISAWVAGAPYRLVAIDGTDVAQPAPIQGRAVLVTAGGRVDLEVTRPTDSSPVRVHLGGPHGIVLGSDGDGAPEPVRKPEAYVDPLSYGTPTRIEPALLGEPDREFRYEIGRRLGFQDGLPGMQWTINGGVFPDVPMFTVAEGDVVRMRIVNESGDVHPMHLHGHHALVLARDGVAATGSPWWTDSLNVKDGETYDAVFRADNPGVWMDHCHNLNHATDGLVTHLMYLGVHTPYVIGGEYDNEPE